MDLCTMASLAAAFGLGTPRRLDECTRLDAEELAMRDECDTALGVTRDPRSEVRVSDPWRGESA